LHGGGATIYDRLFCEQKVYQVDNFITACALSMGDNAVTHRVLYVWIEMFKNGRTSVTDAERSGWPTTQNGERARELILQNRRLMVDETAKQLISALGLPILWCMITFSSIKCVPGGYLRN
jgi:hypothetical protein